MSSFALDGSDATTASGRPSLAIRYPDIGLLALALPVFVLAGWPLVGYAAAAVAWLAQHAILAFAQSYAVDALRRGERNKALAAVGMATLGRVWLVTLAILLVGVLGEREDGLAAALLSLVLVTAHFISLGLMRLLYPEEAEA